MSYYRKNLDLIDKHNMKDVWEHEGVVYSGNIDMIVSPQHEKEYISPSLAAAVVGVKNTTNPSENTSNNIWTDIDAQENYLNTKPTCFLILSKPDLNAFEIGEAVSKKYNCFHLCPQHIINDEIAQNSLTGKCLEYNFRHYNVCSYIHILKMLKQKIESPAVQHRGYVISGIPLPTAHENSYCLIRSNHSEKALYNAENYIFDLIYNLKRQKGKSTHAGSSKSSENIGHLEEAGVEEEQQEEQEEDKDGEEQEVVAELPKFVLNTCSYVLFHKKPYYETKQATLLHQLQELFNLCLEPSIIIYITCPDADVLTKKSHAYINYLNGQVTVDPFLNKTASELRWPSQYNMSDYENPHDLHVFNPKYNCRSPINFNKKAVMQLCNYRHYILPYIEKKIMDYDPQCVIKLDGRTSVYQMMHQITQRLILMSVTPAIIPQPLYLQEPPEELEEFWKMVEELHVVESGILKFRHYASPWFNRCPVELKKKRSVIGKQKFAVRFLKHVYLLSSLDNFVAFCRNPRPFLKLRYLEPTCRIIILGTKSSGKTMVAECLSWLFDTPVMKYKTILEDERQKKYDLYCRNILSEIIATIEDARFMEWQNKEIDRQIRLENWSVATLKLLNKYHPLYKMYLSYIATNNEIKAINEKIKAKIQKKQDAKERLMDKLLEDPDYKEEGGETEVGEEECLDEFLKEEELNPQVMQNFMALRSQLSYLAILDSIEDIETALATNTVSEYADPELTTESPKPNLPVLGDDDVTKAVEKYIIANDLVNEIEPTTEEMMTVIIKILSTIDTERKEESNSQEFYGKYILDDFPSDPEFWEHLAGNDSLLPDYTITLIENREIDLDLISQYLNIEKYAKNHQEVLSLVEDPLVRCKLQTKQLISFDDSKKLHMQIIANDIVNNSLEPDREPSDEMVTSFTESIEKFRENWDSVKIQLESKSKCFIEIELESKSNVEVLEEVFLNMRKAYYLFGENIEGEDDERSEEAENPATDMLTYNNPLNLCETNIFCPFTYYNYGVLWKGKQEFSLKYDNKHHYFAKEEFREFFQRDVTKFQSYSRPFKMLPKLKICVTGCIGSGKTELSKLIATELGLIHICFEDILNYYYMPRHYKKVGRMYENPFTDEEVDEEGAVVEFQMDEENPNLLSDILSNEAEVRRIIFNYFERGQAMLPIMMQAIINKLWFTHPYVETGFVLDGFPRLTQDVEDLVQCNCIPDLVINLESSVEVSLQRISPALFKKWKSQLKDAKEAHKIKMNLEYQIWNNQITKRVVTKLIIEDILERTFGKSISFAAGPANFAEQDPANNEDSDVASNPNADTGSHLDIEPGSNSNRSSDAVLLHLYEEAVEELPPPEDTRTWESPENEREKIDARVEGIFESDYESIESLKELLTDNKIDIVTINATKTFDKVVRSVLFKLSYLRNRTDSFFEQTFIVTPDIVEVLLSQGYIFLSKFGRLCPVYISKNRQMIFNSYEICKRKNKIFPVIHRAYVYFISSKDYVTKFRLDPLKYTSSDALKYYHPYPLKIGIIGAPKSGKSSLASKIARHNNLICISRGTALRMVMENMHWTELAINILKDLREGRTIDSDLIIKAVQTAAIDHRTITYGFVLDGFPASPYEAMSLVTNGLYPSVIFDISSDKTVVLKNSQNEIYNDILKYKPPYSYSFIDYRFSMWNERCSKIRTWVKSDIQNIYNINGDESKWQCLQDATDYIKGIILKIHYYLDNCETKIVPASVMTISNEIFEQKQSPFKNMCPACFRKSIFKNNSYPVDKTGIVQYKDKFYWICAEHFDLVLTYPDYFLMANIDIPEIPAVVKIINPNNVYENGICIVTYAENLPNQKLERGTNKFAAVYNRKTYLFCCETCLSKFLSRPHVYSDITVFKGASWFPRISLDKLPNLGYLEQTLANILTEACCSVNAVRPKYPGLTLQVSAILYIALYLKTRNSRLPKEKVDAYQKALKVFENRSKLIIDLGVRMRSMENPFRQYPECHHRASMQYSQAESKRGELTPIAFEPASSRSAFKFLPN